MSFTTGYWTIRPDGSAKQSGIDHGTKDVKVIAENEEYLAIKRGGHMCWSGIGMQTYIQPRITIYRIESKKGDQYILHEVLDWSTGKKKTK